MMSVKSLKSAKAACDYYTKAVEYYVADSMATCWQGLTQKFLNLEHDIKPEDLERLLEGELPNGQRLQNLQGEHRPGFDMTFSAPKSLSILVGLNIAPELMQMHDAAVTFALKQIEQEFAEVRVNQGGDYGYQKTGNLLFATFRQATSRAQDPNLHTHCVTLNLSHHQGEFRSLSSDKLRNFGVLEQIQNHAHYCGLLYRHQLANLLKESGYLLQSAGDGLFEIAGVPTDLIKNFSKRRADIEKCMADKGWEGAKAASHATLITRANKVDENLADLQQDWQQQAKVLGFSAQVFHENLRQEQGTQSQFAKMRDKIADFFSLGEKDTSKDNQALGCIQVAIEKLSQRVAIFTERDLVFETLKHSLLMRSAIPEEAIRAQIQTLKTKQLYTATCPKTQQTLLTTPWLLTLEAESITRIENNKGVVAPIMPLTQVKHFQKNWNASQEFVMTQSQQASLEAILTTKDRYMAIQGYAGTAKTTMLSWARVLMEESGYTARGVTIASSAAQELTNKAGINSDVYPRVLAELKSAKAASLKKTVFVLDEASMLSSAQGHEFIKQVERTQARLILVGDKAQLPSINSGRLFGLTQEFGIQTTLMDEIVRQKNPRMLEAVQHATQGEVKEALAKLSHVEENPSHEARMSWIADEYLSYPADKRQEALIFAATHEERISISEKIRTGLKQEGSLSGEALTLTSLQPKHREAIQQRFVGYYQPGLILRFNQHFRAIQAGQYYRIDKIEAQHRQKNILPLIAENGQKMKFPLKVLPNYKTHTAAFERIVEVYEPKTIDIYKHETILWTKNFNKEGIVNGETATLIDFNDKKVSFKLAHGAQVELPHSHAALKHLEHGYVLTTYKAQGKDKSYAIGLMESHQKFSANLANFYVQISRAVLGMTLVTDDKEKLIAAIEKNTHIKPAALDMMNSEQLKSHAFRFQNPSSLSLESLILKQQQLEQMTTLQRPLNKIPNFELG